jgi:hypothetical protein
MDGPTLHGGRPNCLKLARIFAEEIAKAAPRD